MTTNAQIEVGTLTANLEERTLSGLLVPYGELGNTNLGKFTVEAGSFTIPRDPSVVTLNSEHDREIPVARATSLMATDNGITATFKYFDTDEADQALLEYENGTRSSLSVEAKNIAIRAGKAVAGTIFGAAQVAKGAFPSAALLASDVGEVPTETPTEHKTPVAAQATETSAPDTTLTAALTQKEDGMTVATVPTATQAVATPAAPAPLTVREVGALYAARKMGQLTQSEFENALNGQNGSTLFAALSDIKFDGTGGLSQTLSPNPQWLGQVWQATNYRQQILPLFAHGDLTALSFTGWKWGTKPSGGDWAGNKAQIPSNTITVSAVPGTASRYAVGHDIAREFVDFPIDGFFEAYSAAVSEDYARWADGKVATAILGAATTLAADALTTLPGVTGGTIGSAASAIIDGATAIITAGSLPDFALVAPALWKQMAKMPKSNVIGYLNASLGLSNGELDQFVIRPSSSVATGKVLVGCKGAATVLELPGSPVRIDALNLAQGGVDEAAFGYLGVSINDATGLQLVTAATS